ncbi:PorP/SprF family type IX secretion system membrane protein [Winogradskyella tangerina]|uniref:PorP/SprF family type IX secretion system membrane protein n=1 Tax=Winogradskyella tangerina TaxID=2023240 RepID=UPI000DBE4ECD|nr:PorP/SprF family type IX secretion system membrane protein [Winogradskyella tangerina]
MKAPLLILIVYFCSLQMVFAQQDDGVVSFDLPVRNSLVFNRYAINPTFTFVREQNKFISFNNKREWIQFDNAPETFIGSYSGRFSENIGAGIAAFQQNYGVLTTFGGLLNFAYNVKLNTDSNLTFGLNVGAYSSGVNTSNIVTNFDDPSLQNVPSNFLMTVNPGINYGTKFLDFGVSFNNLVLYNFESSEMIQDDPRQGIQAHVMHTGYFNGRGFFKDTKFTGILMSEFQQDETIISGIASLNVPKGLWFQVGYNNRFGVSGGVGLNITKNIALEYNVEKAIGELVEFGPSHEITLAYRIISKKRYDYSGDEEVSGLFSRKRNRPIVEATEEELAGIRERAAERRAKAKQLREAEAQAKKDAEANAIAAAEEKAKKEEAERAQREAEAKKAKELADQKAKEEAEQKAKEQAEARAKQLAEQKAKEQAEAEAQAKALAEQKAKEEAAERARQLAEQKAKEEADRKAKEEAEARARALAEQKAKEEAEEQARLLAEQKAKEEAAEQARLLAEQKAKEEAEEQARLLAEQKAKEEAEEQARLLAEQKAQEEAERKAKEEAEAQAKLQAEQQAKEAAEAEAKAKEELIANPKDEIGKTIATLTEDAEKSTRTQKRLLEEFESIVDIKDEDLKDLKEENDLSDQGIAVQPKPFKSVTAENNKLASIKSNLDEVIDAQSKKIDSLRTLYEERFKTTELDEVTVYYRKKIEALSNEQAEAIVLRDRLDARLETIRIATEFEKRRRIKRAAYDNEADRYAQDRAMLQNIKRTTKPVGTPYTEADFDFGENQGENIKILKNVSNTESGYYLIIAVHSDISKRNEFLTKVVASGRANVDFFYDVSTSKYYIYYSKFDSIRAANKAMEAKGDRPYNVNMSLVKIEN